MIRWCVAEFCAKAADRQIGNPFQLAKQSGVGYPAACRIWKGEAERVDLSTLEALCDALHCSPGELLAREPGKQRRIR